MRSLNGITDSMDMSLSKFQLRQGEGHHEGQGSLEYFSSWGHKELDTTYNWTTTTTNKSVKIILSNAFPTSPNF